MIQEKEAALELRQRGKLLTHCRADGSEEPLGYLTVLWRRVYAPGLGPVRVTPEAASFAQRCLGRQRY